MSCDNVYAGEKTLKKSVLSFLMALTAGLCVLAAGILAERAGVDVTNTNVFGWAAAVFVGTMLLLCEPVRRWIYHFTAELDWAEEIVLFYQRINPLWRRSFWIIFSGVTLAFLFYTVHFMWGGEDWAAVRFKVSSAEAASYGRFAAYFLQNLLFDGKILPVINNLMAFLMLSAAGVMLAVYWNVPQKTGWYVLIGLLLSVTPYTFGWLYFAKNMLGALAVPFLMMTGLIWSEQGGYRLYRRYFYNFAAVILFVMGLGTYFAAINFVVIAVLGRMAFETAFGGETLKEAGRKQQQTLANLTAAGLLYVFVVLMFKELGIVSFVLGEDYKAAVAAGAAAVLRQFAVGGPFIDAGYRGLVLVLFAGGVFGLIFRSVNAKAGARGLLLLFGALLATKLNCFLGDGAIAAGEAPVRTDFFSLPVFMALTAAVLIKADGFWTKRAAAVLAGLLVFAGLVRGAYIQKVWKFGSDAEQKLAERIITRLEKMPGFDINRQYKLVQIGEFSLREKYYVKKGEALKSPELLEASYYPAGRAKDAFNFYYQTDFLSEDVQAEELWGNAGFRAYILNEARAWPAKESLKIMGEYIVIVLDETALAKVQRNGR